MKSKISYTQAFQELEQLVKKLESDAINFDKLVDDIKRATFLVEYCKEKLRNIESEIEESVNKTNEI